MISQASLRERYDVAIVGGGPVGSTASALLKKYNPDLHVVVLEKEKFPREHVGESQLPPISKVLDEMGCWDKVERAGFPIKIGASYTWGRNNDRWDFDFFPIEEWVDEPRPGRFEGQRLQSAFQVDRAMYDDILLRHAEELGVEVHEETLVREVNVTDDRIVGLKLDDGREIQADYFIDGSGTAAVLRRALGINVEVAEELKNIAIWDYWENAEWAVEIGTGTTRVQVRSLPYGWIWFIPLGPTRTSIGLICPAEHYKTLDTSPEDLYLQALHEQEEIATLIRNAGREGQVRTCKDWSQLADRIVGKNWFLCGEAAGFADPILAAGLTLAHSSAREAAYTILELQRGELDADWLRERYNERNRANIEQHIRFAKYWYSANGCFTDLQEHCQRIAKEAGLRLSPRRAWQWLSQGGFTTEDIGAPAFGSFNVSAARQILNLFNPKSSGKAEYLTSGHNVFKLNLRNATRTKMGLLQDGRINLIDCYERSGRRLPITGYYGIMIQALEQTSDITEIVDMLKKMMAQAFPGLPEASLTLRVSQCILALDVMIQEHWVTRAKDKKRPTLRVSNEGSRYVRKNHDTRQTLDTVGSKTSIKWNID